MPRHRARAATIYFYPADTAGGNNVTRMNQPVSTVPIFLFEQLKILWCCAMVNAMPQLEVIANAIAVPFLPHALHTVIVEFLFNGAVLPALLFDAGFLVLRVGHRAC